MFHDKILLDNAYAAWYQAINYAKKIKNGLVSLQYRKAFVSNLHNAVELFFKQIMLDQNDYSVIKTTINDKKATKEPIKSFFQSKDLNSFFKNLPESKLQEFYTIDFKDIIKQAESILKPIFPKIDKNDINNALLVLKNYRNSETHFYIKQQSFLSYKDFIKLNNFMLKFYVILTKIELLYPFREDMDITNVLSFCNETGDHKLYEKSFSYKDTLKNSKKAQKVAEIINGDDILPEYYTPFFIANWHKTEFNDCNIFFDDALGYIQSMFDFGLLNFDRCVETKTEFDEENIICTDYETFKLKTLF